MKRRYFRAVLMTRRMISRNRGGGIIFWAWMVSIIVHLIVLAAFGIFKFSQTKAEVEYRPIPTAKISRITKLTQAALKTAKPKIKTPLPTTSSGRFPKLPPNQVFGAAKLSSRDLTNSDWPGSSDSAGGFLLPSGTDLAGGIEFFGSWVDRRKVCYLVDCSGSMQGIFGKVREELKKSVEALQPDEYFYIIFFGGDKLYESGGGRLLRATTKSKSAAYDFIDSVLPAGRTNAPAALERALQIRDGGEVGPSVVYFLTDGFELTPKDAQSLPGKVKNMLERFSPRTRINTIGFWPQSDDREMLQQIAKQSGGECVLLGDGNN